VINDRDVVAKAPKFLVLYKRAGQRVIINANGDMIVRPTSIEVTMQNGGTPPICVRFSQPQTPGHLIRTKAPTTLLGSWNHELQ
jgi:hypothetical protein